VSSGTDSEGFSIKTFKRKGQVIYLKGVIKGLLREKKLVTSLFDEVKPQMVALPISPEEKKGLKACVEGKVKEIALSNLEEIYSERLQAYGKVAVPPPYLAQAYILAEKRGVKIKPIDMDEETFTDFYIKNVSTVDLIFHSQRVKHLKRKRFAAKTANDFALEWDDYINRTTGMRVVEQQRETVMAANLAKIPKKYERVLALMETERIGGVAKNLEKLLKSP
jgi:hypothetical protein